MQDACTGRDCKGADQFGALNKSPRLEKPAELAMADEADEQGCYAVLIILF